MYLYSPTPPVVGSMSLLISLGITCSLGLAFGGTSLNTFCPFSSVSFFTYQFMPWTSPRFK